MVDIPYLSFYSCFILLNCLSDNNEGYWWISATTVNEIVMYECPRDHFLLNILMVDIPHLSFYPCFILFDCLFDSNEGCWWISATRVNAIEMHGLRLR